MKKEILFALLFCPSSMWVQRNQHHQLFYFLFIKKRKNCFLKKGMLVLVPGIIEVTFNESLFKMIECFKEVTF